MSSIKELIISGFRRFFSWLKELFYVVSEFRKFHDYSIKEYMEIKKNALAIQMMADRAYNRAESAESVIRERTDLHADLHYKSDSQIIAMGRFRGRDYVQIYNLDPDDFERMIHQFRDMEQYGHMARVDAPPPMCAVFEHEFADNKKYTAERKKRTLDRSSLRY